MQTDELAVILAPDLREQVNALCAATDAAPAKARLAGLMSEPALAEVAQHAGNWEIRLAAAQRISDPQLLVRIVEATRHRDNRVFRHCSHLLRARRRTLGHAMRAAELAAAFRGILAMQSGHEALPADRFDELDAELNSLRQEFNVPQEFLDLAAAVRDRVQRDAQALRDLGADAAEAESLCARVVSAARPADAELFREKFKEIAERAAGRVAWLAGHPTAAALAHSVERASAILDALTPVPAVNPVRRAPAARKATRRPVPAAVEGEAVRELLDSLALQLQAGQLAEAEETERRIAAIAESSPLPESLLRRLRRERAQLGGMRDWARWGDDQSREQLIRAAQGLLQGERDAENLAAAVTGLREQWKQLDATRHANRKQWERFDATLTQAFRPVLEFRAKRAREEKAAAAAKASLCDQCGAWSVGIDWEKADIRSIAARRHDVGNQWRALPFAGFRAERQLRKRFDGLLKEMDRHIGAARQAEFGRREALIREAEALRDAPQPGNAIKSVTALQARWKDSARNVGLARQEEQALWQRFHAACNAVFAQRDEQRKSREAERAARENERAAREVERALQLNERKAQAARRLDAVRSRFEVLARDAALAAAQASAATLDKGRIERETLLLDLEIALNLPSPASASAARRARQLLRLQERFRPGNAQSTDPQALALRWFATAARSDPGHDARIAAIVEVLVKLAE